MIVEISVFDTPTFSVEHLFDTPNNQALINDFKVSNDALISLLTTRTTK